jgi:hypothetical protein
LPTYKAWVRFSVETMRAKEFGRPLKIFFAKSIEMTPALHPWAKREVKRGQERDREIEERGQCGCLPSPRGYMTRYPISC